MLLNARWRESYRVLSEKVRKILLRKPKEIGGSENRIWLLNARWRESYRVLSE